MLSDPEQRQQYDAVRAMARGGARFTAGGPGGGAGFEDLLGGLFGGAPAGAGGRRNVRFTTNGGAGPNLEDLLGMFGQNAGAPAGGPTGFTVPRQGQDITAETTLTFRQALEGALLNLRVEDGVSTGARSRRASPPACATVRRYGCVGRVCPAPYGRRAGRPRGHRPRAAASGVRHRRQRRAGHRARHLPGSGARRGDRGSHPGRRHREAARSGGHAQWPDAAGQGRGARTAGDRGPLVTVQVAVPQRLDGDARAAVEAFGAATAGENPRADDGPRSARPAGAGDGR